MSFDYTNPAFCLQSEGYAPPPAKLQRHDPNFRSVRVPRSVFKVAPLTHHGSQTSVQPGAAIPVPPRPGPKPDTSGAMMQYLQQLQQQQQQQPVHPNPGMTLSAASLNKNCHIMRSQSLLDHRATAMDSQPGVPSLTTTNTPNGRYALVPIDEIPKARKDRYEILPIHNGQVFHKSHNQMYGLQ